MNDIYRNSIFWVEVERIKPNPYQPRREFDQSKLEELADSIRMYGLLQPLTVTRKEHVHANGGIEVEYELIAGERRLRASKIAGLQQIPVIIRSGEDTDQMKLELAIIENLQREDLNPVDRARAFEKLFKEFGFTQAEIGKKVGKSREYVTNTLRILMLPENILGFLTEGRITEGHTRPLMMLNDRPEEQAVLVKEILLKKLTVREAEAIARRSAQDKVSARHKIDPDILSLERALTERFGTRVTIEPREVGGRLVISFFSAQDLQTLLDTIRVEDERAVATQVFNGFGDEHTTHTEDTEVVDEYLEGAGHLTVYPTPTQETIVTSSYFTPTITQNHTHVFFEEQNESEKRSKETSTTSFDMPFTHTPVQEDDVVPNTIPDEPETILENKVDDVSIDASLHESKGGVTPSVDRPLPEFVKNDTVPKVAPRDDDIDLYSIKNFSL